MSDSDKTIRYNNDVEQSEDDTVKQTFDNESSIDSQAQLMDLPNEPLAI